MNDIVKIIFVLLLFSLSARGQSNHSDKIDKLVDSYIQEFGFNGNVIVYENDVLIFGKSNGYANYKTKQELDINTPFSIGSITKTFTAVSVMILEEQGKLSYSDSLRTYFDDLSLSMSDVTINQLLTHSSGIPDYLENYPTKNDRITSRDVYSVLKTKDYLYFQPGTKFRYCNSGYVLLAFIIEKISKLSYEDFVKQNILNPLKMDKTYFLDSINYMNGNRAIGHDSVGLVFDLPLFVHGDGGLVSTTTDLFKWYSGLTKNVIIADSTFKAAKQPGRLTNGGETEYGRGFEIFKTKPGFNIVGHTGGLGGTGVYFIFQTDLKNCIIAMTNNNCQKTGEMVERISMILNDFDYSKSND